MFKNIQFILHKPQLSENIGACARAMKNFNFSNLVVVNPKPIYPNDKIIATSVGARDIIKKSKYYENLEPVLKNIDCLISTTARFRNKNVKHIKLNELKKIDFKKKLVFYLVQRHQVCQIMKLVIQIMYFKYQQIQNLNH